MGKTKAQLELEIIILRAQQNEIIGVIKTMAKNIEGLTKLVLNY